MDWFSTNRNKTNHEFEFLENSKWYSEVLLPSSFLPGFKGDPLSESHTHSDGVIGNFRIGGTGEGDLVLDDNCEQFLVFEAKMYSKLAKGITNAKLYDQATRNVACMSYIAAKKQINHKQFKKLGFYVIAPEEQIKKISSFREYTTKETIKEKVLTRVNEYKKNNRESSFQEKICWFNKSFVPFLETMEIDCISWEQVINFIGKHDEQFFKQLSEFYQKCTYYNKKK